MSVKILGKWWIRGAIFKLWMTTWFWGGRVRAWHIYAPQVLYSNSVVPQDVGKFLLRLTRSTKSKRGSLQPSLDLAINFVTVARA
jgi:hypothetical protein